MGKTYTKKIEAREERLSKLPTSERLRQSAIIKKKEGRVLDAAEKHAYMMTTEYGECLKLWEVLRTVDVQGNLGLSDAQEKRAKKREKAAKKAATIGNKKTGSIVTKFSDDDDDDDEDGVTNNNAGSDSEDDETAAAASTGKKAGTSAKNPEGLRGAERFAHKYSTIDRLLEIIKPKFENFVRTPRISRVIQSMIKYGSQQHLDVLVGLLAKDFSTYALDAFAHYVIIAMLKHCSHAVFNKLLANVVKECPAMVKSTIGLRVIHTAYTSKLCSAADKNLLLLSVFKDGIAVMKNWKGYPELDSILAQEKDQQKRLVGYLYSLIDKLVCQKDAYTFPFIQRLTLSFMKFGAKDDVIDMCDSLRPHLQNLLTAGGKDGALLANMTFALLEPKMRKEPLRAFSQAFLENACGKYSAPVMARLFDIVYDGQLLSKFVVEPLLANLPAIVANPYGYMILVHLLSPSLSAKERLLTPMWAEYNLYSRENADWNTHTWSDANYNEETVEICPRPAEQTHLSVLRPIVEAIAQLAANTKAAKLDVAPANHRFGVVCRALVNLAAGEKTYAKAFEGIDLSVVESKAVLGKRDRDEDESAAPDTAATKKSSAATSSSAAAAATTTPLRKSANKTSAASSPSASLGLFSPLAAGAKAPPPTPATARKAPQPDADKPVEVSARRKVEDSDDDDDDDDAPQQKKGGSGSDKKAGGKKRGLKKPILKKK